MIAKLEDSKFLACSAVRKALLDFYTSILSNIIGRIVLTLRFWLSSSRGVLIAQLSCSRVLLNSNSGETTDTAAHTAQSKFLPDVQFLGKVKSKFH